MKRKIDNISTDDNLEINILFLKPINNHDNHDNYDELYLLILDSY